MKVKVWDLAVRLFHWALALAVLAAFLTSEEDEWLPTHTRVGLLVAGLVVFRLAWGLWGSRHARFSDFVRSPAEVLRYARDYVRGRPGRHVGHNPLGGVMVVAFLVVLAGLVVTGSLIFMGPEWGGMLAETFSRRDMKVIEEVHEGFAGALLVMIGAHVAGVIVSSVLERQNLVLGMITGRKHADAQEPSTSGLAHAARLAVALFVAVAVVRALAALMPIPEADAATTPHGLLATYEAAARSEDASFAGFRADRGRALYFEEHASNGKTTSCATCHAADPTQPGRTPAGKSLAPLAPSVTPDRFTDEATAEKWFGRNCKQVLGRPCSAREKGDVLAWLLTFGGAR